MAKYKIGTYEDFKRMIVEREATSLFFARQILQDEMPGKPDPATQDQKPPPQPIISGYLVMCAENAKGDVFRFVQQLPVYPTDKTEKSYKEIREKIDGVEGNIIAEIMELNKPPLMYSGEIEDENRGIVAALSQLAAKK